MFGSSKYKTAKRNSPYRTRKAYSPQYIVRSGRYSKKIKG